MSQIFIKNEHGHQHSKLFFSYKKSTHFFQNAHIEGLSMYLLNKTWNTSESDLIPQKMAYKNPGVMNFCNIPNFVDRPIYLYQSGDLHHLSKYKCTVSFESHWMFQISLKCGFKNH